MKLMKADHDRRLEIQGVSGLVRRPVDIDASKTGFTDLRSLRIYRFDAGGVVKGHAEDDEVFLVVMTGSVELQISWGPANEFSKMCKLTAPCAAQNDPFVAYLPPHSGYELTVLTEADIAYARANTEEIRSPRVFHAGNVESEEEMSELFQDDTHSVRMRLRYMQVNAKRKALKFELAGGDGVAAETLIQVRTEPADCAANLIVPGNQPMSVSSWDTVALSKGESADLEVAEGSAVTILMVSAV